MVSTIYNTCSYILLLLMKLIIQYIYILQLANGYSINMCNWIVSYSSISETEKNGMEGQYNYDCDVSIAQYHLFT